mmetsp:Transcript_47834/g.95506  ORF Transcript_47834/g.95506 Transcript_47834/m.95506 type:complete len:310 (-) Transcript_47834:343-1272(-)
MGGVNSTRIPRGAAGISAFAIVLKGSPRIPTLQAELRRIGLDQVVTILMRNRDVDDGVRGCMESHQEALRRGLRARSKAILVVEDDLEWHDRGWHSARNVLDAAMNGTRNADLVFLGGLPIVPFGSLATRSGPGGTRPAVMMWTTAYMASAEAARKITTWPFRGVHFDRELLRLRQRQLVPAVAFQRTPRLLSDEALTTVQPNNPAYVFVNLIAWATTRQGIQRLLEAVMLAASPLRTLLGSSLLWRSFVLPTPEVVAAFFFLPAEPVAASTSSVAALLSAALLLCSTALVAKMGPRCRRMLSRMQGRP